MKKKSLIMLAGSMMVVMSFGLASAYTINYDHALTVPTNGGFSSPYSGVQVETFDSAPLWTWSGSGGGGIIRTGSAAGVSAAPSYLNPLSIADTTKYVSVPGSGSAGVYTATPTAALAGHDFNYFGLWWGSVDNYNSITFYNDGVKGITITGTQAIAPLVAKGSWTSSDNNRYVNFLDLPAFDTFSLNSNGIAFESDNIAVGNVPVPEPGTMLLLGAGLFGLAVYGKRRKATKA